LNSCNRQPFTAVGNDHWQTLVANKPGIKSCKRVSAALYDKVKRAACLLFGLLLCNLAHAQVESGTIVVFQFVNGKFIIAADSRTTSGTTPPVDTYCKIATVGNQLVVARTGGVSHTTVGLRDLSKAWNAKEQLRTVISEHPIKPDEPVGAQIGVIADAWADIVKSDWLALYVIHPEQVRQIADKQHGGLSLGVFALTLGNTIGITDRSITFADGVIKTNTSAIGACVFAPCAAGTTDVFDEYVAGKTARAAAETYTASPEVLRSMGPDAAKLVRLADLAVAFDKSGTIGGRIDALELNLGGQKRWLQRKDNCPETDE